MQRETTWGGAFSVGVNGVGFFLVLFSGLCLCSPQGWLLRSLCCSLTLSPCQGSLSRDSAQSNPSFISAWFWPFLRLA